MQTNGNCSQCQPSIFDDGTVKERTVKNGFRRFRSGDESLEDEEGRGCPLMIDDNQLKPLWKRTHAKQLERLFKN
uniref:Uncharacterized protein n=1 Tax=Heterorhabditis bacteriophora TaxID=37862 RepID=A0A1I7XTT6_HETBA